MAVGACFPNALAIVCSEGDEMRYQRELDTTAGPRFTRWYVKAFGIAAAIGLLLGLVWVIAGLLHFNPLW